MTDYKHIKKGHYQEQKMPKEDWIKIILIFIFMMTLLCLVNYYSMEIDSL